MHAVVNLLRFAEPVDPTLFERACTELAAQFRAFDGFDSLQVVQAGERDAILLIKADSAETLDRLAAEAGGPWMRAEVLPLLSAPPDRHLGPIIASVHSDG